MLQITQMLNTAFDRHTGKVNVLLRFEGVKLSNVAGGVNFSTLKTKLRSFTNIDRYATVGAPKTANTLLKFFNHIIPIDAKSFESDDEANAWHFVNVPENLT